MKRLVTLILSFLIYGSSSLHAQHFIGYCPDQVAEKGLSNALTGVPIASAAAFTRSGLLAPYQHCQLSSLSIGLSATDGITTMRVWVREHLSSADIISVDVPVSSLTIGWNTIALPTAIDLAAYDTLYCGYEYVQSQKNVKAISYAGSKGTPLSFYISSNGRWNDYSPKYGPVSIRAGIESPYSHHLWLQDIHLSNRCQAIAPNPSPSPARGKGVNGSGEEAPIIIEGTIVNLGSEPLQQFNISIAEDSTPITTDTIYSLPTYGGRARDGGLLFGQSTTFRLAYRPRATVPAYDNELRIRITQTTDQPTTPDTIHSLPPCGGRAGDGGLSEATLYYDTYSPSLLPPLSPIIVEEFTSERNGFAPLGQQRLRQAIATLTTDDQPYVILSHHEGYGPADPWRVTQGSDYQASYFGPECLTFAPAAMINRSHTPFSTTLPADSIATLIQAVPATSAIAAISAKVALSDRTVSATVTLQPYALTYCASPRLVLCLVQPEATSIDQHNYYPELVSASQQYDVIRCYLHNVSGRDDLLQTPEAHDVMNGKLRIADHCAMAPDGTLTYQYRGTLPADVTVLEGLTLVAYIYDEADGNSIVASYRLEL